MNIIIYSPTAAILSLCGTSSCIRHWKNNGTESYEKWWSNKKEWPQYKYLAIPIYKFTAAKTNSVFGVAVSFFVTDLLMHQFLPQLGSCIINKFSPFPIPICYNFKEISWYPLISLGWLGVGAPVIYAKYLKSLPSKKDCANPT